MNKKNISWGGRFSDNTNDLVKIFNASINFDKELAEYDILGSISHVTMLAECDVINKNEADSIVEGLEQIRDEINNDDFQYSIELEDIHMNIEARLIEIIGNVGKKLHTARSRNDQVATDIRLYLRNKIDEIILAITKLQQNLLTMAEKHTATIMPSFTHMQAAQVINLGHHLMAYYEMLKRDKARLSDCRKRINIMPLGSGAVAGTTYPINRNITARLLGFDEISANSLDAVSDRDFLIEFLNAASIIMMHLSRFSEELIIWSSAQFDFISIGDSFCTGSSMMPQKKNPDIPELIRGKTSRVYGSLMAMLTLMKAQPLAYNKDNQEDKEGLFDAIHTVLSSVNIFAQMIPEIEAKKDNMLESAIKGYTTATDLADYLVKKGVAFRDSHEIVGKAVAYAIKTNKDLSQLTLQELQEFSQEIKEDVFNILTLEGSMNARDHFGGTASNQVAKQIKQAKEVLDNEGRNN